MNPGKYPVIWRKYMGLDDKVGARLGQMVEDAGKTVQAL